MAIEGQIGEIVVAHKDRLARFGFELIENIVNIPEIINGSVAWIPKTCRNLYKITSPNLPCENIIG